MHISIKIFRQLIGSSTLGAGLILIAVQLSPAVAADVAGNVLAVKGEVSARDPGGTPRALSKGAGVLVGDRITTGAGSYVVIEFIDGAKATVRPDSELVVDQYAYNSGDDGAVLNLVNGGLRALTGTLAHQPPESYEVRTNVATLGVRGTEFDIRLCETDCAAEENRYAQRAGGIEGHGYTIKRD